MKTKDKRKQQQPDALKQEGIRMDGALKARIIKYQEDLLDKKKLDVSFSEAVRSLIEMGLDAAQ